MTQINELPKWNSSLLDIFIFYQLDFCKRLKEK